MTKTFEYGVDLGWASQIESRGYSWINEDGNTEDIVKLVKDMGATSVRLRLFVNPPKEGYWDKPTGDRCMLGFCDTQSVISFAKRVKNEGLSLMLDFHYSDLFADPQFQIVPKDWENDTVAQMTQHVHDYTKETLEAFKNQGIEPRYVQNGNEINPGLLLPYGDLNKEPQNMTNFLNASYDAIKEVFPNTEVITHIAMVTDLEGCSNFFRTYFGHGGKTDMLGFSYYPYWYGGVHQPALLSDNINKMSAEFDKDVMITEVGGEQDDEESSYTIVKDTIEATKNIPNKRGRGVYYWEPEACKELLSDGYMLCASVPVGDNKLKFNKALKAYIEKD